LSTSVDALNNLPDIDFVDKNVDTLLTDMIAEYQDAYQISTGESKTLASGDPVRIWIYAQALRIYAAYQLIDQAAKYNLLKYSTGDYLENLGARVGVIRDAASGATVTQQFTLSKAQTSAVTIPAGTRVSTSDNVFFATMKEVEIAAESTSVTVSAECVTTGTAGNGYTAGQINILVDPIQFVASTVNTTKSQGGADEEDDDALRGRIFLKPESFSVAGPSGAYEYFVKDCKSTITDVKVLGGNGTVNVYFILEDGVLPESTLIEEVAEYLSADTRRPLTDKVNVAVPGTVNYSVNIDYYIKKSDQGSISTIKTAVSAAVAEYIVWQKSKIGRDINPAKLVAMVMNAGANRVVVNSPEYTVIGDTEVAVATGKPTVTVHDKTEELEDE
jgi:phage-related baseplate assembly protein